jgi:hypothetical protein
MNIEELAGIITTTNDLLHALQEDGFITVTKASVIVCPGRSHLYKAAFTRGDVKYRLKIGGKKTTEIKHVWLSVTDYGSYIDGVDTKDDLDFFLEQFL